MNIAIPDGALVLLVGPSGAGKSTFARKHFAPSEVISSDLCRELVADDERDMAATPAAFRVLHSITHERLRMRRLVVVDATNLKAQSRKPLVALARKHGRPVVGIVFDLPVDVCLAGAHARISRLVPDDVVRRHHVQLKTSLGRLRDEGFGEIFVLGSQAAVDAAVVVRTAPPLTASRHP